jgi:hypothetical protein
MGKTTTDQKTCVKCAYLHTSSISRDDYMWVCEKNHPMVLIGDAITARKDGKTCEDYATRDQIIMEIEARKANDKIKMEMEARKAKNIMTRVKKRNNKAEPSKKQPKPDLSCQSTKTTMSLLREFDVNMDGLTPEQEVQLVKDLMSIKPAIPTWLHSLTVFQRNFIDKDGMIASTDPDPTYRMASIYLMRDYWESPHEKRRRYLAHELIHSHLEVIANAHRQTLDALKIQAEQRDALKGIFHAALEQVCSDLALAFTSPIDED